MTDISWLSQEAKAIHDIFYGLFFALASVMLICGVIVEYFRLPLAGVANFSSLIGRCLIATILLVAYPDLSNWIAQVGDGIALKVGGLNSLDVILERTSSILLERSWSWTSGIDTLLWISSFVVYGFLYITVFIFDAIILYGWTLLYIFSPILILMYILPQTASATALLFRSHIELASWKIVWSTLGTLLWSTAIHNLNNDLKEHPNFFVVLAFMVLVAFSIILTPKIVGALTKSGVAGAAASLGAASGAALSAGVLGPAGLAKVASAPARATMKTGAQLTKAGIGVAKYAYGAGAQGIIKDLRLKSFQRNMASKKVKAAKKVYSYSKD